MSALLTLLWALAVSLFVWVVAPDLSLVGHIFAVGLLATATVLSGGRS